MGRARLLVSVLALGLGVAGAGCKKSPDDALVVFSVQVNPAVPPLAAVDFTVDQRADIRGSNVTGDASHRSFVFGYYLPGVNGNVTIVGQAVDAHGCVLGRGTLSVTGVRAGQTTTVDPSMPLVIAPASGGCDGGIAPSNDGSPDTGPVDAGGDRKDATSQDATPQDATPPTDGGGSGDGPATKLQLGVACSTGSDCASSFCVDGVCCESACTGSCQACAEMGTPGKCVAVMGTPRPTHPACAGAGTPCVGTCDGASLLVCSYPGASQACSAGTCTNGTATLAADCDGKGGCPTAQTVSCAPNTCSGTICAGGCSSTQPCSGSTYCAAGVCKPTKANGQTCMAASECTSGACADGYCCNTTCAGLCLACNLTASLGTCSPVKSANDDTCNGMQSCDATGACKKANGQKCTAASDCTSGACVDSTCCGSASCPTCQACTGGGGTCVAVTSADDPDSCTTTTSSCDATGACKLKAGQSCAMASQCVSGFCADGVCCNAGCSGECEACAETSSKGTCVVVSGAPRVGHGTCAGGGTSCAGTCGGTIRTACSFPPTSTSCRAASCANGTATLAANCDGNGGCPALQTVGCAPNTCAGTVCAGGCSTSQPCAGSNYCSAGACVPQKGNGSACMSGLECTSGSCVDGVCCGSPSCATCQTCASSNGTCVTITSADDPNSCNGTTTCDATGTCKTKTGQSCTSTTLCLSGNCVDNVCCNSPCNGTCQYCGGIASSNTPAGTCGNVSGTPKHGSCAGTGTCQGSCNGAQSTCTMPGSSVMCGSPSCNTSTDMSTAASFCDGQGNCPAGSTAACNPFLCGGNACLTACSGTGANQCVSGAACIGGSCQTCATGRTACGNVCADLTSDPNHCGACTTGCSGSTPLCVNRKCVQCGTLADCHSGYATCSNNTCVCRQPSATNVLPNSGFDTNINGWSSAEGMATWSPVDADACPSSGSLTAPNGDTIVACFPNVKPNTLYFFGFKYLQNESNSVTCELLFTSDTACSDGMGHFELQNGATTNAWASAGTYATSPATTAGLSILCSVGGNVNFDQFYLNSATSSF